MVLRANRFYSDIVLNPIFEGMSLLGDFALLSLMVEKFCLLLVSIFGVAKWLCSAHKHISKYKPPLLNVTKIY